MNMLNDNEWESINKIILDIYSEEDSSKMRKKFIENLRLLVPFSLAEFSLGNNDLKLYDSVEANMISGEKPNILEKYYHYKDLCGSENLNWIFLYPYSYVVTNATSNLKPGDFENSKFNTMFLKQLKMNFCCTITLRNEGNFLGEVSLYSSAESDFSERDIYILNQIKEHLSNRLAYFLKKGSPVTISKDQVDHLIKSNLTEREIQLFKLLLTDMTNESIAKELSISINTVKKHIGNIFDKLDIKSRSQLRNFLNRLIP